MFQKLLEAAMLNLDSLDTVITVVVVLLVLSLIVQSIQSFIRKLFKDESGTILSSVAVISPPTLAKSFLFAWVAGLVLVLPFVVNAQDQPEPNGQTKPPLIELKITKPAVEGKLALYNTIKVPIDGLQEWVKQRDNNHRKLILNIDGNRFVGLEPLLVDDNTKLQFDLKRIAGNQDNKDAWNAVLSRRPKNWERDVPVTIELENGALIRSKAFNNKLTVVDKFWFYVFVVSFLIAIILFWWLAYKSDIIRDTGPQPGGTNKKGKPNRKPFSLARTQMAFWFFIVVISYVFIWMVTSDLSNLTTSVLALIGISAATGLGSAMVDSSRKSDEAATLKALAEEKNKVEAEADTLQAEINSLTKGISEAAAGTNVEEDKLTLTAKQTELAEKQKEVARINAEIGQLAAATAPAASRRFIDDILSDDDGVSFYRFQIFGWTIVLILIFIFSVYNALAMPDFDTTLLALMGISGGTYLGFKLPNQQG
jgi:hypothetical protein